MGDHADKHLHDLALFAIKEIQKDEELTFDYVDGVSLGPDERDGKIEDMTRCLCGSFQVQEVPVVTKAEK